MVMRVMKIKLFMVALVGLAEVISASSALAASRVALVIGNSTYTHIGRLPNAENDAADMASALRRIGFEVTTELDTVRADLTEALRIFARRSARADMSLVFYAGHGIEMDGVNYLVPVDARLEPDVDVRHETVTLTDLLRSTTGASLRVVILDACRNNPLVRSMQRTVVSRSLNVPPGSFGNLDESLLGDETLVAYAAAAGTTAADGRGRNSPYTSALLSHLEEPLEILTFFRRVRADVLASTNGRQRPHEYQSLIRDHYLGPTPTIAFATPKALAPPATPGNLLPESVPPDAYTPDFDMTRLRELAEGGNARAQTELGERYDAGATLRRNYRQAVHWFRRAAEQGFAPAQTALGRMHYFGRGAPQDHRAAVAWYRFAAEQNYAPAQFRLGYVYASGTTELPRDNEEAARWYRLAARQGHPGAQNNLAMMYLEGRGVPRDPAAALLWFRQAAELGERHALFTLGYMYEIGEHVERNPVQAAQWYRLAADHGHPDAQTRLRRLR